MIVGYAHRNTAILVEILVDHNHRSGQENVNTEAAVGTRAKVSNTKLNQMVVNSWSKGTMLTITKDCISRELKNLTLDDLLDKYYRYRPVFSSN